MQNIKLLCFTDSCEVQLTFNRSRMMCEVIDLNLFRYVFQREDGGIIQNSVLIKIPTKYKFEAQIETFFPVVIF